MVLCLSRRRQEEALKLSETSLSLSLVRTCSRRAGNQLLHAFLPFYLLLLLLALATSFFLCLLSFFLGFMSYLLSVFLSLLLEIDRLLCASVLLFSLSLSLASFRRKLCFSLRDLRSEGGREREKDARDSNPGNEGSNEESWLSSISLSILVISLQSICLRRVCYHCSSLQQTDMKAKANSTGKEKEEKEERSMSTTLASLLLWILGISKHQRRNYLNKERDEKEEEIRRSSWTQVDR